MLPFAAGPPNCIGVGTYPPGATYGPRLGNDWAFIWIIAGKCEYYRAETRVTALPGSVVLERPGAIDGWRWDPHQSTRHAFVHFDLQSAPTDWGDPLDWPFRRDTAAGDLLQTLFRHLLTWRGRLHPAQESLTISTMVAAFVTGSYPAGGPTDADPPLPPPVRMALTFLYDQLDRDTATSFTLTELAAAACVSPEHLCRVFRSALGHGPMETVRLARLDRALSLLLHTNYAVGEVASRCGFHSGIAFTQAFRSAFGMPPSDIRRRVSAGDIPPSPRLYRVNFL